MARSENSVPMRLARDRNQYAHETLPSLTTCTMSLTTLYRKQTTPTNTEDASQRSQRVTGKVLSQSDLLLLIFQEFEDDDLRSKRRALFLAAGVCNAWYHSSARVLWPLVSDPQILQRCLVSPMQRINFIRRVEIAHGKMIWTGSAAKMPNFDRLKSLEIHAGATWYGEKGEYMKKLLRPSLSEFRMFSTLGHSQIENDGFWLKHLRGCINLKKLHLGTPFNHVETAQLEEYLMNANLEVISLGFAFNGAFSDRTLALTFAIESLNSITIDIPVTGETVQTLKTQCNGTLPLLNNL